MGGSILDRRWADSSLRQSSGSAVWGRLMGRPGHAAVVRVQSKHAPRFPRLHARAVMRQSAACPPTPRRWACAPAQRAHTHAHAHDHAGDRHRCCRVERGSAALVTVGRSRSARVLQQDGETDTRCGCVTWLSAAEISGPVGGRAVVLRSKVLPVMGPQLDSKEQDGGWRKGEYLPVRRPQ